MIGAWFFGSLADVHGRKKVILPTLLGCILAGLGYSLANSFLMFAVCRLLFGFMKQGLVVAMFSLMVEVVGASKRSYVTVLNQVFFTAGICFLPVLAYCIRSWRIMCVALSLLGIGFLPMWK